MKIISMTATFGKLSHQTLDLKPGLNVIEAPNEWGKSTWCAFLVAMFYGIDTRQITTKTALADKERFAPWNGEPMSGQIRLLWNDRDITIQRSTKGRIPFGQFQAFETETGLEVPELTAANCGQTLLGVERSVFVRSAFIRLQDMPVSQDDALRRRLNNLVTTGDESGAGDTLGKQLRELKNKCRYNRSGLLPQAEYEREQLREQLRHQAELQEQIQQLQDRQSQLEDILKRLNNHADALRYQASKQGAEKIQAAAALCKKLEAEIALLEADCASMPSMQEAEVALQTAQSLQQKQRELAILVQASPQPPAKPEVPAQFAGMTPAQAQESAAADHKQYQALTQKGAATLPVWLLLLLLLIPVGLAVCYFALQLDTLAIYLAGGAVFVLGLILLFVISSSRKKQLRQHQDALLRKYPGIDPADWLTSAQRYADTESGYSHALAQYQQQCGDLEAKQQALSEKIRDFAGDKTLEDTAQHWENIQKTHQALSAKQREYQNATEYASALHAVATTAPEPAFTDTLELSQQDTERHLQTGQFELKQLQLKLGQCIGQLESIGQPEVLKARLDGVVRRIARLEDYYRALELAQDVLYQASTSLQRRFAPRINKQAQAIFSRLTDGRYQKILLSDDLTVTTSAENEDILRGSMWRSDGTVDQLYLSLRLAVAGELMPDAPLVLDDALLRFDDNRLKATLSLLQEQAEHKQVILFSCQSREKSIINNIEKEVFL